MDLRMYACMCTYTGTHAGTHPRAHACKQTAIQKKIGARKHLVPVA
jgi:hypothetical protein